MGGKTNPVWVSGHYHFYADDAVLGSETSLANEDVSASVDVDTNFRLRINWGESAGQTEATSIAPYLQYRINSGSWVTVGAATAVKYVTSSHNTDGDDDSADRISTAPTGCASSSGDQQFDTNNTTTSRAYADQYGELIFNLQMDSASISNNDTVDFQLVYGSDTAFNSYDTTPSVTAVAAAAYVLDILAASVPVAGGTLTLLYNRKLSISAAVPGVAGGTLTLQNNRLLNIGAATPPVSGGTLTLQANRSLGIIGGTVPVTGGLLEMLHGGIGFELDILPGAIPVSGGVLSLTYDRKLGISSATVPVAGGELTATWDRYLSIQPASVGVSGGTLSALFSRHLDIQPATVGVAGGTLEMLHGGVGFELDILPGNVPVSGGALVMQYSGEAVILAQKINGIQLYNP